jgi:cellulose synthase/poly-beta-1,6-N-acetylglucosamine synthase-like glycosyltransferase
MITIMTWVFWIAAAFVGYAYSGYPMWLWVRAHLRPRPARRGAIQPTVSVVMVVRNEEAVLRDKLHNLLELEYPAERCQIVVVSDGSTDGTETILREHTRDPRVHVVFNQLACGKACGLNDGMQLATGDVVLFTDARQKIEPAALRLLMESFADSDVGAVSGELMLGDPENGESGKGMGLYWRIEKRVRELEAASGSVVGATGALYAVRRELVAEVPADTILDDVFIPMNVARKGFRVLFDPRAKAWDSASLGRDREFRRKVRTLTGNYQLLQLAPWLLTGRNPLRFEFVSHKLIRLVVPFALIALLVAPWFLAGPIYETAFFAQVAFYGLSILGGSGWKLGPVSRLVDAAFTFVSLNAAALVAFANFITGHTTVWMQPPLRKEMRA